MCGRQLSDLWRIYWISHHCACGLCPLCKRYGCMWPMFDLSFPYNFSLRQGLNRARCALNKNCIIVLCVYSKSSGGCVDQDGESAPTRVPLKHTKLPFGGRWRGWERVKGHRTVHSHRIKFFNVAADYKPNCWRVTSWKLKSLLAGKAFT